MRAAALQTNIHKPSISAPASPACCPSPGSLKCPDSLSGPFLVDSITSHPGSELCCVSSLASPWQQQVLKFMKIVSRPCSINRCKSLHLFSDFTFQRQQPASGAIPLSLLRHGRPRPSRSRRSAAPPPPGHPSRRCAPSLAHPRRPAAAQPPPR